MSGATCRGSYILGSACGHCDRCAAERNKNSEQLTIGVDLASKDGDATVIVLRLGQKAHVIPEPFASPFAALLVKKENPYGFEVGDLVDFTGEDSYYKGHIVAIFQKKNGAWRVVVEDERRLLLIKNPNQARRVT